MDVRRADLHVHSNRSDGSDAPARVVERARQAGLAAIALTDHDTTEGLEEAIDAGRRLGVEVVAGIEISCEYEGREVHVLAYFIRPDDPELGESLARMRDSRSGRIERMVERLHARGLPVRLDDVRGFAAGQSIGRPHIADALVKGGFVSSYEEVWRDYLRPGGLVFVEREKLPLGRALALIARSGGVASMAHPTLNLDLPALETIARDGVRTSAALEANRPARGQIDTTGGESGSARPDSDDPDAASARLVDPERDPSGHADQAVGGVRPAEDKAVSRTSNDEAGQAGEGTGRVRPGEAEAGSRTTNVGAGHSGRTWRLQAFETAHPRVPEPQAMALGEICRRYGLIESGGSDCHGNRRGEPAMGSRTVAMETVEALRRLGSPGGPLSHSL